MKKIVLVLLGLTSMASFSATGVAAIQGSVPVKGKQAQQLTMEQTMLIDSTVVAAVNAATTTVGASVVSGTIISHIG